MSNLPIEKTSDRLKKLMETYDVTIADIAKRTGLDRTTVWKYVNDKQMPRQDKVYILATKFAVNPAWLLGYDVPMKLEDAAASEYHPEIQGTSEITLEIGRVIGAFDRAQLERVLAYAYGIRDGGK